MNKQLLFTLLTIAAITPSLQAMEGAGAAAAPRGAAAAHEPTHEALRDQLFAAIYTNDIKKVSALVDPNYNVIHALLGSDEILEPIRGTLDPYHQEFPPDNIVNALQPIVGSMIVPINITNHGHETALIVAARKGYRDIAHLLLVYGADVNARDRSSGTALMAGAVYDHRDIVQLILDLGVDINVRKTFDMIALTEAARWGGRGVVELLLDRGADINGKDDFGRTPLMNAALGGQRGVVELLLDRGADINVRNDVEGRTALMGAAIGWRRDVVELLLDRGADVNVISHNGETALMLAERNVAVKGNVEIAQLLRPRRSLARRACSWAKRHWCDVGAIAIGALSATIAIINYAQQP